MFGFGDSGYIMNEDVVLHGNALNYKYYTRVHCEYIYQYVWTYICVQYWFYIETAWALCEQWEGKLFP